MVVVVAAMVVREEEELVGGSRVCRCSGVAMMVALRRSLRDLWWRGTNLAEAWWSCGSALQRLGVPPRGGQKCREDGVHGGTVAWCRFRRGQEVAAMAAGAKMVAADMVQWCPVARLAAAAVWRVVGKLGLGFHV